MASSLSAPPAPAAAMEYPSSDGKPMAESDSQRKPLTYAVECLGHYFRNHPEVYVSGNLLIYYEEGTLARVAPDVFVVFGARNRKEERATYLLWEEEKAPDFVLEITSPGKWRADQTWKRELYRRLGVREYWQYDPTRDYLDPPLQGLELVEGEYEPLPRWEMADGTLAARSEVLGLELRVAGRRLRFYDPQPGELPDLAETDEQRREAESRAEREAVARQAAETRVQQEAAARQAAETRVQQEAAAAARPPARPQRPAFNRRPPPARPQRPASNRRRPPAKPQKRVWPNSRRCYAAGPTDAACGGGLTRLGLLRAAGPPQWLYLLVEHQSRPRPLDGAASRSSWSMKEPAERRREDRRKRPRRESGRRARRKAAVSCGSANTRCGQVIVGLMQGRCHSLCPLQRRSVSGACLGFRALRNNRSRFMVGGCGARERTKRLGGCRGGARRAMLAGVWRRGQMASSISAPPAPARAAAIDYPSSDGKPMAESESQLIPLTYAVSCLRHYFRNRPEAFASGNLLIYYEEGTLARVAPDVFVVFGSRNRKEERASYRLWEEAKAPDFVLEITSPGKWRADQTWKRELYRRLGVREYWQYDPTRDYLDPPLQGLELVEGEYEPLPRWEMADGTLAARSEVLGLELRVAGRRLRFYDPQPGELPDLAETDEQRREAESRAEQEAVARRQEAAARQEPQRPASNQEAAARQPPKPAARQEAAARQAAEARLAELEALLRRRSD